MFLRNKKVEVSSPGEKKEGAGDKEKEESKVVSEVTSSSITHDSPKKQLRVFKQSIQERGMYIMKCLKCMKLLLLNLQECGHCKHPNIYFSPQDSLKTTEAEVKEVQTRLDRLANGEATLPVKEEAAKLEGAVKEQPAGDDKVSDFKVHLSQLQSRGKEGVETPNYETN